MAPRCKRCKSRSIVYDRSLGGRPVCSACGTPFSETKAITGRRSYSVGRAPSTRGQIFSFRSPIAWLLPISLVGCYLYLTANPRVVSHWLAPYSPSSRNSWWIKTPADVELLIDQAQKADSETVDPLVHGTIRELITSLKDKGVRLLISERVMEHAGGEWDPGLAEIRLRTSTVTMGSKILAEVLAHETAHVAQSCRAGGLGKNSEQMGIEVNPAEVFRHQLDSPLYKGHPSTKAIELEAFSVGANPPWAIKLLAHFCKS